MAGDEEQNLVMDRSLIRMSYWVAAIADFVIAVLVLLPGRMGVTEFVYPMGLMSAVAFSWGVLLIVADRKPVERRWVLLPTTLVVFLLGVFLGRVGGTFWLWSGLQSLAVALFTIGVIFLVS